MFVNNIAICGFKLFIKNKEIQEREREREREELTGDRHNSQRRNKERAYNCGVGHSLEFVSVMGNNR